MTFKEIKTGFSQDAKPPPKNAFLISPTLCFDRREA